MDDQPTRCLPQLRETCGGCDCPPTVLR